MSYENFQNAVATVREIEQQLGDLTARYEKAQRHVTEARQQIEQAEAERRQAVDAFVVNDETDKGAITAAHRREAEGREILAGAERVSAETLSEIERVQRQLSGAMQARGDAQRRYWRSEMHEGISGLLADRKAGATFGRIIAAAALAGEDLGQVLNELLKLDQQANERVAVERDKLRAA